MNERTYTQAELVAFGNYLLSEERENALRDISNVRSVSDADVRNFFGDEN